MTRRVTPLLTVDIIIRMMDQPDTPIVLVERRYPPYGWALPGGFVDVGETLERAAIREAMEETSLEISLDTLLGCYSDPARDSRGHTVSAVFVAQAKGLPRAADDAKSTRLIDPCDQSIPLVFDHRLILDDFLRFVRDGTRSPVRP